VGKPIRKVLLLAVLALAPAAWEPASACSLVEEYVRPTDFELVQIADAVVVATARGAGRSDGAVGTVRFEVGERLKGGTAADVEVYGDEPPSRQPGVILVGYRPEGHQGVCDMRTFRTGHRYLLFLERMPDGHMRAEHAFSRADEDYSGRRDPWVAMIRRYAALQAKAPAMEQIAILQRMLKTGRDSSGARLSREGATGITEHLASLSPYKPTPYLLAAYAALGGADPRAPAGPSPAPGPEAAALQLLAQERSYGHDALGEARRRILVALVNGDHPDARPLFERLAAATPPDPSTAGLVVRYFARNGAYGRAFAWIETRLMATLPLLDAWAAKRLIGDVAKAQEGGDEGSERWRGDPHAAAAWPELALALYWYQVRRFGADDAIVFADAIRALPYAGPRARPPLTLALAHDYADGVAEWAVAELRDGAKRRAWEALPAKEREGEEDPALLPLRVLLAGWTADNAKVVRELFCQSEARRLLLIDTLGEEAGTLYGAMLADMAASDLSAEARDLLAHATLKYAARERRMIDAGDVEKELLPRIVARERVPGVAMTCPAPPR